MKKQYKIQLPKGKKVIMTNVDFEDGVMTVNVELGKDDSKIWDKIIQEYGEAICGKTEQKYEPKEGDFIYLKWKIIDIFHFPPSERRKIEREAIAIFKGIKKCGDINGLFCYVTYLTNYGLNGKPLFIYDNMNGYECSLGDVSMYDEIRPATEKEKKLLIDKLAEVGKRWNEEDKTIEDVRWRAEVGETFYYIDRDCMINSMNRNDFRYLWKRYDSLAEQLEDERMGNIEYMLWKKGNYFKTREAAEKVAGQIRGIFKNSKAE